VAELSPSVVITLSLDELADVVGLLLFAAENLEGDSIPAVVDDLATAYSQLMEDIQDAVSAGFEPAE
jgi:hypothetical protein